MWAKVKHQTGNHCNLKTVNQILSIGILHLLYQGISKTKHNPYLAKYLCAHKSEKMITVAETGMLSSKIYITVMSITREKLFSFGGGVFKS